MSTVHQILFPTGICVKIKYYSSGPNFHSAMTDSLNEYSSNHFPLALSCGVLSDSFSGTKGPH